jgi:hypothetical protein
VARAFVLVLAGCGGSTGLALDRHSAQSAAGAAGTARTDAGAAKGDATTSATAKPSPTSPSASGVACEAVDPYAFLRCDVSKLAGVAWGEPIMVVRGHGDPPEPMGGTVVPGGYRLVAETRYGEVPPDLGTERPGDRMRSILYDECGVVNLQYMQGDSTITPTGIAAGNDCRRLVTQTPPLREVTGWMVENGPAIPDARSQVAYSAIGTSLVLIDLRPYEDFGSGAVLGSYTTVREYDLISSDASTAPDSRTMTDDTAPPDATSGRDVRCPEQPAKEGVRCTPDPAPLECEYGGDAWTRCTTLVRCTLDVDGSFHFRKADPSSCTPPNPADCPATFAEAQAFEVSIDGGVRSQSGLGTMLLPLDHGCNYDEGVCGCQIQGSRPDQEHCNWHCRNGGNVSAVPGSECPWPRPRAGDACHDGLQCNYAATCHGNADIGPSMICQNGYWATFGGIWFGCPP